MDTLEQSMQLDIIYESVKYSLHATRNGPNSYVLAMNNSFVEVCTVAQVCGGFGKRGCSDNAYRN